MSDFNYGGIGDPVALGAHQNSEAMAEREYEQFERELDVEIENNDKFLEGARLISQAYEEWENYCLDKCCDPDKVDAMVRIKKQIFDLTGEIV